MCIQSQETRLLDILRMVHPDMPNDEIEKIPVMIIRCYFDESGILPTDEITVLAGFMGSPEAMDRLKDEWNKALERFGVKVPFHSKEFFAPVDKIALSKTNPYSGWSTTKRDDFIGSLHNLIADPELRVKAVAIDSVAFRSKTESERRYLTGGRWFVMKPDQWLLSGKPASPYHFGFRIVVEGCAMSVAGYDRVHLIMSTQDNFEGYAVKLYQAILDRNPPFKFRKHMEPSILYASHKTYAQLQAADLAAYWVQQIADKRRRDLEYSGTEQEQKFMSIRWESSDVQFATSHSIDKLCARYSQLLGETDRMAHLRRNQMRTKINHNPEECQIIGKVDAAGNYRVADLNT